MFDELECISDSMLCDAALLAALDGDADPTVLAHLEACDCCAGRAALLSRFEHHLHRCLARNCCPPTLTLIDYSLRLLDHQQQRAVFLHLAECSACAAELVTILAAPPLVYRIAQAS